MASKVDFLGHHMVIGALVKGSPISKGPRRRYDLQVLAFVCIGPFHIPCNVVVVPVYRLPSPYAVHAVHAVHAADMHFH